MLSDCRRLRARFTTAVTGDEVSLAEVAVLELAIAEVAVSLAELAVVVATVRLAAVISNCTSLGLRTPVVTRTEYFRVSVSRIARHVNFDNLCVVGGIGRCLSPARLCQRPRCSSS